jgi:dTDP-4-dehydrorhamnose reductase
MHPKETRRLNVEATQKVAETVKLAAAKLVFFSTDYVFDGEKKTPYMEKDPTHALNEYGRQKVAAENAIQTTLKNHLIVRISGVFGWELKPKNFVLQLLDKTKTGKVKVASDLRYNPTYAPDIAAALADLVSQDARGVFHLSGSEQFSKYDFGRRVADVFGLDASRLEPAKSSELSPVRRPACSSLDCSKLFATVPSPPMSAGRALEAMKEAAAEWEAYSKSLAGAGA